MLSGCRREEIDSDLTVSHNILQGDAPESFEEVIDSEIERHPHSCLSHVGRRRDDEGSGVFRPLFPRVAPDSRERVNEVEAYREIRRMASRFHNRQRRTNHAGDRVTNPGSSG